MKNADRQSHGALEVLADVQSRLRVWRRRLLWQRLLYTLAAMAVLALVGHWLATPLSTLLQQLLAVALVWFALLWLSPKWRSLSTDNFLQHLNRRFPDFEESAQLLVQNESELSPLQCLQRERALTVYQKNLEQVNHWQSQVNYRSAGTVLLSCLVLFIFTPQLGTLAVKILPERVLTPDTARSPGTATGFKAIAIRIEPPAYTGLEVIETDQPDLEVPQDSLVKWNLSFETNGDGYALQLSDDRQIVLAPGSDQQLHVSAVIDKTGLYRFVKTNSGDEQSVGEIYSLAVKRDRSPVIRMIEPELATLEIPKTGPAHFTSQALVKDDYGVQTVEILASVAKGSGEGVKFRDEKLQFDQSIETGKGHLYQKQWDLEALGMEPGDEIYFTVIATDNRLPQANTGRSETLIVRWLEDQPAALAADGLAIDFIPEFFKSQRQIIIDTEQLIEDKPQLPAQAFKNSSYETGRAQASLKQKYGQYLGDEFDEGPGAQAENLQEVTDTAGDAHDQHEDDHGGAINSGNLNKNLNSTADIIRLFGHDHGAPEIGPITKRNPVALMKRAVNEMWQAERHLMQAEPELALPFEYEAYKYLKLARQADRIYVKRLGFEPPPVSEERRMSGELDEILSYRLSAPEPVVDPRGQQWNNRILIDIYHLLTTSSSETKFSKEQRELLSLLSKVFTDWSQQQAALIQHAATLEKLSLAGRLTLENCETCLADLETTIWNLIDEGKGQLYRRNTAWYADDGLIESYQQVLQRHTGKSADARNTNGGQQ